VCVCVCVCACVCVQDLAFLDLFLPPLVRQLLLKPCIQLWHKAAGVRTEGGRTDRGRAHKEGSDERGRAGTRRGANTASRTLM
jgi:hypothetical protein